MNHYNHLSLGDYKQLDILFRERKKKEELCTTDNYTEIHEKIKAIIKDSDKKRNNYTKESAMQNSNAGI